VHSFRPLRVALVLCLTASCHIEHGLDAHVEQGTRIPRPVFKLSRPRKVDMVSVEAVGRYPGRVGGVRFWTLAVVRGGSAPEVEQVTYGEAPAGYSASSPARALFPGRYALDVTVSGQTGRSYFRVRDDGSVVDASAVY
jgi:hypothetical protein